MLVYNNIKKDKKIAIVQSNYIPWKGYFDIINMVDEFIIYDDAQYTKRDWRNRNKIKTKNGLKWLTIPVRVKGRYFQAVKDVIIKDKNWVNNHIATIRHSYSKARFFKEFFPVLENIYLNHAIYELYLSNINLLFIKFFCKIFKIETKITLSSQYTLSKIEQTEKLIELCLYSDANIYLSGPSARDYINTDLFKKAKIKLEWYDYNNYKVYKQLYFPFTHHVSVIDLLLNEGKNSYKFLKSNYIS